MVEALLGMGVLYSRSPPWHLLTGMREGGAVDAVRGVEEELLQPPWQVGIPHQAQGRRERMMLDSHLDHVVHIWRLRRPGSSPGAL